MIELVTSGSKYFDRKIATVAYVNIDGGELVAYPYKDSYIARDSSVSVGLDFQYQDALQAKEHCRGRYCLVSGVFVLERRDGASRNSRLGRIKNPTIIAVTDFARTGEKASEVIMIKVASDPPKRDPRAPKSNSGQAAGDGG